MMLTITDHGDQVGHCYGALFIIMLCLKNMAVYIYGHKPQICRWNFDIVCYSFSNITICGFVGYFRLLVVDEMVWEHFCRFAVGLTANNIQCISYFWKYRYSLIQLPLISAVLPEPGNTSRAEPLSHSPFKVIVMVHYLLFLTWCI